MSDIELPRAPKAERDNSRWRQEWFLSSDVEPHRRRKILARNHRVHARAMSAQRDNDST
jgi:hypothetical protein